MTHTAHNNGQQIVYSQQSDELTQDELERLIKIARAVKGRRLGKGTIDIHATNGGLYIMGWRKAA